MQFFDFQNAETFRYFNWLCQGSQDAISMVIENALAQDHATSGTGGDASAVAQTKLAEMLEESMEAMFCDWAGRRSDFAWSLESGENDVIAGGAQQDFLFIPMLIESVRKINYVRIAEALLIHSNQSALPDSASEISEAPTEAPSPPKKTTRPVRPKTSRKTAKLPAEKTRPTVSRPGPTKKKKR